MAKRMSLATMPAGRGATVYELVGGQSFVRRLEAMGIKPGTRLRKTSGSYLGGPVVVRTGNIQLALGFGMASKVMVDVEAGGQGSA